MDHRAKCILVTKKNETTKDNIQEILMTWPTAITFFDTITEAWSMKERTDKMDFIKIKNFSFT